MLGGYQRTSGLEGMGCGITPCEPCDRGMGSLLDPTTWGPSDWLVAVAAGFVAWRIFKGESRRRYRTKVFRRLGAEE